MPLTAASPPHGLRSSKKEIEDEWASAESLKRPAMPIQLASLRRYFDNNIHESF